MTSPQLKSYLNMKISSFYCKIRNKKRLSFQLLLFATVLEFLEQLGETKKINDIHIRAEEAKLSLLVDDIDLNIENPKDFSKNYQS